MKARGLSLVIDGAVQTSLALAATYAWNARLTAEGAYRRCRYAVRSLQGCVGGAPASAYRWWAITLSPAGSLGIALGDPARDPLSIGCR